MANNARVGDLRLSFKMKYVKLITNSYRRHAGFMYDSITLEPCGTLYVAYTATNAWPLLAR